MSVTLNGTSGLTFNDATTQNTSAFYGGLAFRNRIINGSMQIDQRNAGASVTPTANTYTLDRWQAVLAVSSKFSVQQSSTAPTGFVNSLLVTSLSAYTVGSTEYFFVRQKIEGLNMADFAWGTASAATVTLSFWVRSSLTGTFGGAIRNSAQDRAYPFSFTISSANTWEQKSVTIAGDTTGTWLTTNGIGLELDINLGSGSTLSGTANTWAAAGYTAPTGATSVVGTNGATFYITGVQLEKGSTATSFDYRPYGTELQLCQRYYEKSYDIDGVPGTIPTGQYGEQLATATSGGQLTYPTRYAVLKRTNPTLTFYAGTTASSGNFYNYGTGRVGPSGFSVEKSGATNNGTVGFYWTASAEL